VARRPFIHRRLLAFLLLIPLAATSTAGAFEIGGSRWRLLHRIVISKRAPAVIHFWWKVKADTRQPRIYFASRRPAAVSRRRLAAPPPLPGSVPDRLRRRRRRPAGIGKPDKSHEYIIANAA